MVFKLSVTSSAGWGLAPPFPTQGPETWEGKRAPCPAGAAPEPPSSAPGTLGYLRPSGLQGVEAGERLGGPAPPFRAGQDVVPTGGVVSGGPQSEVGTGDPLSEP